MERPLPPGLDLLHLHRLFGIIGGVEIGLGMPAWQRRRLPVAARLGGVLGGFVLPSLDSCASRKSSVTRIRADVW